MERGLESAARMVEHLFVIVVKEDRSVFSYKERKAMVVANQFGSAAGHAARYASLRPLHRES